MSLVVPVCFFGVINQIRLQASGALTASNGPYPLIAADEAGPFLIYNWNLQAIVKPSGEQLSGEDSWAYARRLLQQELGSDSSGRIYRHHWQAGDLVLWDNWGTIHSATAACLYGDEERLLHRVRLRVTEAPQPWNPGFRMPQCAPPPISRSDADHISDACAVADFRKMLPQFYAIFATQYTVLNRIFVDVIKQWFLQDAPIAVLDTGSGAG